MDTVKKYYEMLEDGYERNKSSLNNKNTLKYTFSREALTYLVYLARKNPKQDPIKLANDILFGK